MFTGVFSLTRVMASSALPFTTPLRARRPGLHGVSVRAAQGFGFRFIDFLAKTKWKNTGLGILFLHA